MAIGTPTTIGTNTFIGAAGVTLTTSATVPSDALVIVQFTWASGGTPQTLSSVSGGSLSWSVDHGQAFAGATSWGLAIASAQAPAGLASGTVITPTFSGNLGSSEVAGCYCTGLATSSAKDVSDGNGQASNLNWDTTATSTTFSDTLVFGGCIHDALTTNTATGGATELHDFQIGGGTDQSICTEYKILSAAGSASLTGTWAATSADSTSGFVAYKGLPAGPAADTETRRYQVRRSRMTSW